MIQINDQMATILDIYDTRMAIHEEEKWWASYRPMPIFRQVLATSISSHFESISGQTPSAAAYFRRWIWTSELLKCLRIISGVCTPSMRPGGTRWDGWTSEDKILSMLDAMSSTRLLTNLGATWRTNFSIILHLLSEDKRTADAPWSR